MRGWKGGGDRLFKWVGNIVLRDGGCGKGWEGGGGRGEGVFCGRSPRSLGPSPLESAD